MTSIQSISTIGFSQCQHSRRRLLIFALLWIVLLAVAACFDRTVADFFHSSGIADKTRGTLVAEFIKLPGVYNVTLVLAGLVMVIHCRILIKEILLKLENDQNERAQEASRLDANKNLTEPGGRILLDYAPGVKGSGLSFQGGLFIAVTGVSGLLNSLLKWIVGRTRPFKLDDQILHGLSQPAPFLFQPFRGGLGGLFRPRDLAFPSGHACIAFATATGLAILFPKWRWVFYGVASLTAMERVLENAHYLSDVVGAAGMSIVVVHLIWHLGRPIFRPRVDCA